MKISKFAVAPLLIAIAFSMSACDRSDWVSDETHPAHEVEAPSTSPQPDDEGGSGVGITYKGKLGIDMGGGMVTPIGGLTPQLGMGF